VLEKQMQSCGNEHKNLKRKNNEKAN